MNDREFGRLIEKYQKGQLSNKEKKLFDLWFESMGNDDGKEAWTDEDKQRLKAKILSSMKPDQKSVFMNKFKVIHRVAASVIVLAALAYTVLQYGLKPKITIQQATSSTEINKVILPDGSLVWLKGNSRLNFPTAFSGNSRNVTLQGEALFEVAKDPAHPFVIQCGDLITTVLGTSFNIKTTQENIEVVVLTGKVSLTSVTDKQGLIVLPNQKAVYNGQQKQLAKVESAGEEKMAAIKGTEYNMEFEDTPMKEIIKRIEGKFNVKVHTRDPKLNNCMVTGNFTDQSLEGTINIISQALSFEYEIMDDGVLLKGAGCE